MKTILELTPHGRTMFSLPDLIYDLVRRRILLAGRGREKISVAKILAFIRGWMPEIDMSRVTVTPLKDDDKLPDSSIVIFNEMVKLT